VGIDSDEGRRFAADVARLDQPYSGMVHRKGGAVNELKRGELSHKIHLDLATLSASDFAIAYLGQDGTMSLGTTGTYGARQVLYGVAYDVIRGLATGVVDGLNEVSRRWSLYNFGRETYPRVCVQVPDLEAEQARAEALKRRTPMLMELEKLRGMAGEGLSRELVEAIADTYGQKISEPEMALWMLPKPPTPVVPQIRA
jgi:hypothetical protein